MSELVFIKDAVQCVREWRERLFREIQQAGCDDLSFRPNSGSPSLGWLLAHQAAVYDFSTNMLIKKGPPRSSEIFNDHRPGTTGDWTGLSSEEIQQYYDDCERDFLEWIESASEQDLAKQIAEGGAPPFFVGMTIRKLIATMFTHLNFHSGHLALIKRELITSHDKEQS